MLDDRERSVRRWSGEEFKLHCHKKTVKLPPKIIVWGAISPNGTSRLHIVEGTKNATEYIEGSIGRLQPQVMEWYGENPWMFQQDSAPCHMARAVKTWYAQNDNELLPWAGNSPDMNPIGSLWNIL